MATTLHILMLTLLPLMALAIATGIVDIRRGLRFRDGAQTPAAGTKPLTALSALAA